MDQNKDNQHGMSTEERKASLSLAAIFCLRMLGLFLILPVFALYAEDLEGVTPLLIGAAIGAYGLTQAILQIPFGMLSDRIGRKPVIIMGLLIFAAGSVVAANADTIWGIIAGRLLQGSGAIAAAIMALAADLSREEHRTKMMATIGISIGMAFTVSLILGPLLNSVVGVPGIFWFTAVLAIGGVLVVIFIVPTPKDSHFHRDTEPVPAQFSSVLSNPNLLRLDFGILILHMVLTALFLSFPLALRDQGLEVADHWHVYLPVMVLAMGAMVPFIIIAEKRRKMKPIFLGAISVLALSLFLLYFGADSLYGLIGGLFLFFTAFNLLEASLPSLISKIAPAESKGTAMGVYTSSQFIGAFLGGIVGGWVHSALGLEAVFLVSAMGVLLWLISAWGMAKPSHLSNSLLRVGEVDESEAAQLVEQLLALPGVEEAVVIAEDGIAYLKVDSKILDRAALDDFAVHNA
ncbi:MAG: MFS transporter [Candidatus Polarisedimenticolaceae bacterium]|nr:MFS transporter [Candidatus Polarisedimenticolaceae bacterium]